MKEVKISTITGPSNIFFGGAPISEYSITENFYIGGVDILIYSHNVDYDRVCIPLVFGFISEEEYESKYMNFIDKLVDLVKNNKRARSITDEQLIYELRTI